MSSPDGRSRVLLSLVSVALSWSHAAVASADTLDRSGVARRLAALSVPFVENQGQIDSRAAFYARTSAGTLFVTREGGVVYSLPGSANGKALPWGLAEEFIGGRAVPVGGSLAETRVSHFVGSDPSRWRTGLPTHHTVELGEVWAGVTLSLAARGNEVEKLFTLAPGASPASIRVRVRGADFLRADAAGALVLGTGGGRRVILSPPIAFQFRNGKRMPVGVSYRTVGHEYGFRLGAHDPDLPVVIDPILQSTYVPHDRPADAMAINASGEILVTGATASTTFPNTTGGGQPTFGGGPSDAYIARFNSSLTTLIQATYFGGTGEEFSRSILIHPVTGDVFIGGDTLGGTLPMVTGGPQTSSGGGVDGFVARFNSTLTVLLQSTYLGGIAGDRVLGLTANPSNGDVYAAGYTESNNFPNVAGGFQTVRLGAGDAFVARLNSTVTANLQSTYFGGTGGDFGTGVTGAYFGGVAFHSASSEVIIAGITFSLDLPQTSGGAQSAPGGNNDGFVARLNAALTAAPRASYYGGTALDRIRAVLVHPTTGDIVVVGDTTSSDLPNTAGNAQPAYASNGDALVARFNSALTSVQGTYLGGAIQELGLAVAIHPTNGQIYVAGQTNSSDFPGTAGGAQPTSPHPDFNGFASRLNSSLTTLLQSTYIGGNGIGDDAMQAIRINPVTSDAVVAGFSSSTAFPNVAGGAFPTYPGGIAQMPGVVSRLTADLAGAAGLTFFTVTPCRVLDTRDPDGPFGGPALAAGATRDFIILGHCNIPIGALAVFGNVTITGPTAPGHLTIFPAGTPQPVVSTINFQPGQTRANNGIFVLGSNGAISVVDGQPAGTVHFILDVAGYF